jgi:hypothetical protein
MTINEIAVLFAFTCFIGTLAFLAIDLIRRPLLK